MPESEPRPEPRPDLSTACSDVCSLPGSDGWKRIRPGYRLTYPVLQYEMMQSIAKFILSLFGWRADSVGPDLDKYVLIGAPHTSNWDFPLTLLGLSSMGVRFNWVAKHTLFRWPFNYLFRAIGGIPVDRSTGTRFLKHAIELFEDRSELILAIAPEGTRSRSRYWKTGFYTIAHKAGVPVALGFIDYPKKLIGIGKIVSPTGDIQKDFEEIREFYQDKVGKYPQNQGEIRIKASRTVA